MQIAGIAVLERDARPQLSLPHDPYRIWADADGTPQTLFYRTNNHFLVRFPAVADFDIADDGNHIQFSRNPGVADGIIEHLLLNQVLPLAMSRQYKLVLHAGAVEIGNRAVVFLGDSGLGKSTLTASFAVNGFRFLTDDGMQLERADERYLARPSHPSLRLLNDSRLTLLPQHTLCNGSDDNAGKSRLLAGGQLQHCSDAREIGAFYVLGDDTAQPVISAIAASETMIRLVRHCFLLGVDESRMLQHQFHYFARLAQQPVFFRLDYPRAYDRLGEVRSVVLAHLAGLGITP